MTNRMATSHDKVLKLVVDVARNLGKLLPNKMIHFNIMIRIIAGYPTTRRNYLGIHNYCFDYSNFNYDI